MCASTAASRASMSAICARERAKSVSSCTMRIDSVSALSGGGAAMMPSSRMMGISAMGLGSSAATASGAKNVETDGAMLSARRMIARDSSERTRRVHVVQLREERGQARLRALLRRGRRPRRRLGLRFGARKYIPRAEGARAGTGGVVGAGVAPRWRRSRRRTRRARGAGPCL
jgi:hypothetical protein